MQHRYQLTSSFVFMWVLVLTGCVVAPTPPEPASLANTARDQIGNLAIRGPTRPTVSLTANLNGKGAAAGRTAASASAGWLDGVFEASSSGEEGAVLFAALGIMVTPLVAAGGAAYGAAAADSRETVAEGNRVLERTLDFAPAQLQHALLSAFTESAPVDFEWVTAGTPDAELVRRGFDSVLDVTMESITSQPSQNQMHVYFDLRNRVRLTDLDTGAVLAMRSYNQALLDQAVSSWAGNDGADLTSALNETFSGFAGDLADHLFVAPAIRVRGIEPISRNPYRVGRIPGRRPMFVWTALDGSRGTPQKVVEYEIALGLRKDEPHSFRTHDMRFVPAESLEACKVYHWQIRAHYVSFGAPTSSDWSPEYRFKTSCD